ncbi:nitroreductase family protein [Helicovermis profundi]|uniref:Nitroreductase family protein n=1 Tax=Helicovermis profundi TaxID=3065157 RepID=A0AAU9E0T1_9FIRM|nr:nitroreductase family protein [Clostridia bacterium S502]
MKFLDLAKQRYSVRSYLQKKVEKNKLNLILEAGNVAPTGGNKQPYSIVVVKSDSGLECIKKAANIHNAPLAIVVCGKSSDAWVRSHDDKNLAETDATIVTDHMMLEATELNLGSLWVCNFNPAILRTELSIPEYLEPLHILAIGYSDETPLAPNRHKKTRKSLSQDIFYESFES